MGSGHAQREHRNRFDCKDVAGQLAHHAQGIPEDGGAVSLAGGGVSRPVPKPLARGAVTPVHECAWVQAPPHTEHVCTSIKPPLGVDA